MQAVNEVKFVLETSFNRFGLNWETYEDDYENLGAERFGRTEKYSVEQIIAEHESSTLAVALREAFEEFAGDHVMVRIHAPRDAEKIILLINQLFLYLRKTSDWFQDIFSDFDSVTWPYDDSLHYSEGCRRILHQSVYLGIRVKIRNTYFKNCMELRRKYSYFSKDIFECFHKNQVLPLLTNIAEWDDEDDIAFWWQPLFATLEEEIYEKMKKKTCDETNFVVLANCCKIVELLLLKNLPDNEERSHYNRMKGRLEDAICKAYWERTDRSFLGLFSRHDYDSFLFGKLLGMLMCSQKQADLFIMNLKGKIKKHFEFKAITLLDVVSGEPLALEQYRPLFTEFDETKAFLWKRLEILVDKFPRLAMLESEIWKNFRDDLDEYRIEDALARTEYKILDTLKQTRELDSVFWEEADLIALFIKHLGCHKEIMSDLEIFARSSISSNSHHRLSTLVAFVSRYRSLCSIELVNILVQGNLIERDQQ